MGAKKRREIVAKPERHVRGDNKRERAAGDKLWGEGQWLGGGSSWGEREETWPGLTLGKGRGG